MTCFSCEKEDNECNVMIALCSRVNANTLENILTNRQY